MAPRGWRAVLLAGLFLAGCTTPGGRPPSPGAIPGSSLRPDYGDVVVVFEPPSRPEYRTAEPELRAEGTFARTAAALNAEVRLPDDVTLAVRECGAARAYYDPGNTTIGFCYELLSNLLTTFRPYAKSDDQLDAAVLNVTVFVLFHEAGHALVHLLELPITGREEDAVDQLSTLLLLRREGGEDAAVDAAVWFLLRSRDRRPSPLAYADEHSLGQQRFYNIVCWVYGRDPAAHPELVEEGWLPPERAERCADEYGQMAAAWARLLRSHLQDPAAW